MIAVFHSATPIGAVYPRKRVLGNDVVLGLAQEQADRRLVVSVPQQVVDGRHVHAELAQVTGVELAHLEFDDDEAAQRQVVEEQVGIEVLVADFQVNLLPDEREALAEFQEELLDVVDQRTFEVTLPADVGVADEVEEVRVAGRFLRHVGVWWGSVRAKLVMAWPARRWSWVSMW